MELPLVTDVSKRTIRLTCLTWVITVGTVLTVWNVHVGYTARAKVVGLLMLSGVAVYTVDMVTTMYHGETTP